MSRLDQLHILILKLPEPKRLVQYYSFNIQLPSTHGVKCCIPYSEERTGFYTIFPCGHLKVI